MKVEVRLNKSIGSVYGRDAMSRQVVVVVVLLVLTDGGGGGGGKTKWLVYSRVIKGTGVTVYLVSTYENAKSVDGVTQTQERMQRKASVDVQRERERVCMCGEGRLKEEANKKSRQEGITSFSSGHKRRTPSELELKSEEPLETRRGKLYLGASNPP